jgi:hypothetical protein
MVVLPITPDEVVEKKIIQIPDEVIIAFNNLIVKNWDGTKSRVYQKDIVKEIKSLMAITQSFEYDWLNVEQLFEKQGWIVKYDSPSWGDNYEAYFLFTRK